VNPRPGEICLADLGLAAKTRPVVIVSRFDPKAPRALIIYIPLTAQNRESSYEVPIPKLGFLNAPSVANVQGIRAPGSPLTPVIVLILELLETDHIIGQHCSIALRKAVVV